MWKWIGGCAVLVVACVIVLGYTGYKRMQKFTERGGTTELTIAGTPARVFASLANADSVQSWMGSSHTVSGNRHGLLQPGDTIARQAGEQSERRKGGLSWVVVEVREDQLLVMKMRSDSTPRPLAMRRDSLVAVGDSTRLISTIGSPIMESAQGMARDSGSAVGSRMIGMSNKLVVSTFRLLVEEQLKELKAHIEGPPVPSKPKG